MGATMSNNPGPHTAAPDCGRRLMPVVIDQLARDEPRRAWCSLPFDDYDLSKGYEDITYSAFANAINKLAWCIESNVGKPAPGSFETIAYLGIPDIRYHMIQMAVCKTGHKVLFSSQLNSAQVHLSLMEQTECGTLLTAKGVQYTDLLRGRPMKHAVIPDLDDLLDLEDMASPFPYTKSFEEAKYDPYLILHSSGTTGFPKPIVYNHAAIAAQDSHELLSEVESRGHVYGVTKPGVDARWLSVTSPYHAASAIYAMVSTVFGKSVLVPGFRHRGTDVSDIYGILNHSNVTTGLLMPWMMEDIARKPNAQHYIERLKYILFGGATLSSFAASIWEKYTVIQNAWGATECACGLMVTSNNTDHEYIYFDMANSGYEFREVEGAEYVSDDGTHAVLYELVATLSESSALCATWHARMGFDMENTSPPFPEWATGDLWTPHPDPSKAAYAWKFACRADDIISFTTGVNAHPAPIHRSLTSHEIVSAAIVVGNQHRQALALVEVADGVGVEPEVAKRIWEEAICPVNDKMQMHMRIPETHIALAPSGSFIRTAKGSVVKKRTEMKFLGLINDVYTEFGDKWQDGKERYGSISQTTEIQLEVSAE